MSAIVLNSNANSALINTINASSSKMNPNVYSSPPIFPSSATVWQKTESSSGSIGANNTLTFDLMKYGIAEQMLLCYTKDTNGTIAYDFLDVIDRVELLSSSKVIDTLTNYDILALASDLDFSQYTTCSKSFIAARDAGNALICVPLVFSFFKSVNTNLNLQFNEPMSVRVRFGAKINYGKVAGTDSTLSSCYLRMRYKAYNEADYSEVLTQNYNESELNQLVKTMYDENIVNSGTVNADATNGDKGTPIELKNTDCVNSFYVTLRAVDATKPSAPQPISRIRFTASGQEIFDLSGEELYWSRLALNGFSVRSSVDTDATGNVVKIQLGRYEYPTLENHQSNTMSLRELNNPKIQVFFTNKTTANATFDICVVEEALSIVSTISSSGRVQQSLSN